MENFELIKNFLDYYRTLEIKNRFKENLFIFISSITIFLFFVSLSENFYLNTTWVKITKVLFIFIFIFIFARIVLDFIVWRRMTYEQLSLKIESKSPEFNNHLINSWQLSIKNNSYPEVLIKKIRNDTTSLIKTTDISKNLNRKKLLLYRKTAFIGFLFLCLYIILFPQNFRTTFSSLFLPFSDLSAYTISAKNFEKNFITDMKITYDFPKYTGLPAKKQEQPFSDISCLTGTDLTIEPIFKNKIGNVFLIFGDGSFLKSKGYGNKAKFRFKVINSTLYEFKYYDLLTKRYITTQKHLLTADFEHAPYVQFIKPGRDIAVDSLNISIPLKIAVSDNFGARILSLKYHIGSGEISPSSDPVFFQTDLKNAKKSIVSAFLKIPQNISTKLAYYAECTDNNPVADEVGRSSVFYIYPPSLFPKQLEEEAAKNQYKKIKETRLKMEEIKKQLEKFITSQISIIKAAKKFGEPKNLAEQQKLKELAENEKKWLKTFQKMMNDLNNIGSQTRGKFTLAKELVEMMDHVQSAEYGMIKPEETIAVTQAEMGLELAKEITSNIEKWLAESPDNINWKMPEPPAEYNVPEAPLPSELEDMIGDLINNEQDMQSNIQETTTKWMDSLDKGAGWSVADGPISNMSAKGITGNLMPGSQEVGGRSGEGRTGRSYGEMVGNTAIGKGGRQTPAELTPDNIEPGVIKDKSGENSLGPTGGGKLSGLGPEGLQGPAKDNFFTYNLLATQQKKLVEKAEALERSMTVFNVYNPQLQKAISAMKEFHMEIKKGRYTNLLTTTDFIISNLEQARHTLIKNAIIDMGSNEHISKEKYNPTGIWDEKIPPGYENVIWKYYSKIFNH